MAVQNNPGTRYRAQVNPRAFVRTWQVVRWTRHRPTRRSAMRLSLVGLQVATVGAASIRDALLQGMNA